MACCPSLVALALGYVVLSIAYKEKEGLKLLGQAIGTLVIIGAIMSLVCLSMKCAGLSKGNCAMSAQMCPMK